jgi:hypothetical protein
MECLLALQAALKANKYAEVFRGSPTAIGSAEDSVPRSDAFCLPVWLQTVL